MGCRIDDAWTYRGLRCIRLENEHLAVDVLPELGGNIFRFIDKARDHDLLWKSPRVRPHRAELHANFDDHWAGGWDEAFPGGAPSPNRYGDELPYMGELWTQRARHEIVESGPDAVELAVTIETPITPARWTRRLRIERGSPTLAISYRLEHTGHAALRLQLGHPSRAGDHSRPSLRRARPGRAGRRERRRHARDARRHLRMADARLARRPPGARARRRVLRAALPHRAPGRLGRRNRHGRPARVRAVLRPRAVPGRVAVARVRRLARATTTRSSSRGRGIRARSPMPWPPGARASSTPARRSRPRLRRCSTAASSPSRGWRPTAASRPEGTTAAHRRRSASSSIRPSRAERARPGTRACSQPGRTPPARRSGSGRQRDPSRSRACARWSEAGRRTRRSRSC